MERDEVQGFTRVMTQLCSSRPFDDYSVPIRSLIGKLEAETAAHLDKAPARAEPLKPPSAQPEPPAEQMEPQPEAVQSGPRHRSADLQLSQRRLAMLNEVTSEIAKLYDDVESGACDSVGELKSRHPGFRFWGLADTEEQEALWEGNPNPKYKEFARQLVYTRHLGRSEEQVKYDRKTLREAGEELPS